MFGILSSLILQMEMFPSFVFNSTVFKKFVPTINACCIRVSDTTWIVIKYDVLSATASVVNSPKELLLSEPIPRNFTTLLLNFGAPILTYWSVLIKVKSLPVSTKAMNLQFAIGNLSRTCVSSFWWNYVWWVTKIFGHRGMFQYIDLNLNYLCSEQVCFLFVWRVNYYS